MYKNFITFEGGEGSGKTTQIKLLAAALEKSGVPFIATREPGGCVSAEKIRSLLVTGDVDSLLPVSETLLFNAARYEHIYRTIKPALAEGKTVICDRFFDSTLVYQALGKGLGAEYIQSLHNMVFGNFMPNITIILDIDPKEGLKRASSRSGDETRFENLDVEFHNKIRKGFLDIAKKEPSRCIVFNALQDIEALHNQIMSRLFTSYNFPAVSSA